MKNSQRIKNEQAFVESRLGNPNSAVVTAIICERCKATLASFAEDCTADLADSCPGFLAIEKAKRQFARFACGQCRGYGQVEGGTCPDCQGGGVMRIAKAVGA